MPNIILKVPVDFQFGSGGLPHKPGKHYISEELFDLLYYKFYEARYVA